MIKRQIFVFIEIRSQINYQYGDFHPNNGPLQAFTDLYLLIYTVGVNKYYTFYDI